jgi:hypothetical protein
VPGVYIESSFRGHKAIPGKYSMTLRYGNQTATSEFEIVPNPLYTTDAKTYEEYHKLMSSMEAEVTSMHKMINTLYEKRQQLEKLLQTLSPEKKNEALVQEGNKLVEKMKAWDEDMIQRKSKAYDDVENFPNKFTANYLFMVNHAESDLPRVNQSTLDRLKELNAQWSTLQSRGRALLDKDIPAFNQQLWSAGVGAIWKN